jgi:hypothetical protein
MKKRPRRKKPGDNPAYRTWIRSLICVICYRDAYVSGVMFEALSAGMVFYPDRSIQPHITECAHVGDRGFGQKCPDNETVPLCSIGHHREGSDSSHRLGKSFWTYHRLDRDDLIRKLQETFAKVNR